MTHGQKVKIDDELSRIFKTCLKEDYKRIDWYKGVLFAAYLYKNGNLIEMQDMFKVFEVEI